MADDVAANAGGLEKDFHLKLLRLLFFWILGLAAAAGLFVLARELTACWRLTALPGIPPASCDIDTPDPLEGPVLVANPRRPESTATPEPVAPEENDYPAWDGGSRINILFVGLRGGDTTDGDCPLCTDTLILLTVDPVSKTAGMLSIPRDMWVNIPGFGYNRINTAWSLGVRYRLPGDGPALTMKTVSHFIGVPVDYYVQVDFDTFVDVIDLIGGVDIYNDETIVLDIVAHGQDFPKSKLTCCGMRHLNGRKALAYARCRKESQGCTDGDVGRARRQQKVIFAIRDRVLAPENFPDLLSQAPLLYRTFSEGIQTNMALDDAIRLAVTVREISRENIRNKVIDHSMATFGNTTLGGQNASVLKPLPDKIRVLRDEIFTSSGPASPLARGDAVSLMRADNTHVRVLNGSTTAQLELLTAAYLSQQGMRVTEMGKTKVQSRTTIIVYSPSLYTMRFLVDILDISSSTQILIRPDPSQTVNIEVRLGNDWVGKAPRMETMDSR